MKADTLTKAIERLYQSRCRRFLGYGINDPIFILMTESLRDLIDEYNKQYRSWYAYYPSNDPTVILNSGGGFFPGNFSQESNYGNI